MLDQGLLSYIKIALAQGKSRQEITATLTTQGGWSQQDVDAAFAAMAVNNPPPQKLPVSPAISPIMVSPMATDPRFASQKKNHSGLKWVVASLLTLIILIIISAGLYFYVHHNNTPIAAVSSSSNTIATSTNENLDGPPVNDSDLRVVLPVRTTSCPTDSLAIDGDISNTVTDYVNSTTTIKANADIQSALNQYASSTATYLVGGPWLANVDVPDSNSALCGLSNVRSISALALAQAKILIVTGQADKGKTIIENVLSNTQTIENNSQAFIGYLVAIAIKTQAVNMLTFLKNKGLIQESAYKPILAQYNDDATGLKKSYQYEYSVDAQLIDNIAAGNFTTYVEEQLTDDNFATRTPDEIDRDNQNLSPFKNRTEYSFEPNNTKQLFYNLYEEEYKSVDLQCGSPLPVISFPTFNYEASTTENYLGQSLFYTYNGSVISVKTKNCQLENQINQF